jgi:hypothetical protein
MGTTGINNSGVFEDDAAMFKSAAWWRGGVVLGRYLTADDIDGLFDHKDVTRVPTYVNVPFHDGISLRDNFVEIEGKHTQLTADGFPVGVNGARYSGLQASTLTDTAARLLREYPDLVKGGVAAVTIGHGTKLAITLELEGTISIPGYSDMTRYLSLADSRDGQTSAVFGDSLGVTVCENTFAAYVLGKQFAVKVRHTGDPDTYYKQAVQRLMDQVESQGDVAAAVERLANEAYTADDFSTLVTELIGKRPEEEGRGRTMWDKARDGLWERHRGDDIAPLRFTKLGALMAVQGYEQHVKNVRGADRQVRHFNNVVFAKQPLTTKASELLVV